MDKIFRQARYLIVWLGEFSPGEDGSAERRTLRYHSRFYPTEAVDYCDGTSTLRALTSLAQRSWHSRRWVIQEFVVGEFTERRFLCGDTMIDWREFYDLLESYGLAQHVPVLRSFHRDFVSSKSIANSLREDSHASLPLLHLLYLHGASQCSDDRDRLYALRGLARKSEKPAVDYSLATSKVYFDFARGLLASANDHTFAILASATVRRGQIHLEGLPLWVPDWTVDTPIYQTPEHRTCVYFATSRNYAGRFGQRRHYSEVTNSRYLTLQGHVLSLCFPPAHRESDTQCRCCILFAKTWYQTETSNSWSPELKEKLAVDSLEQKVLFVSDPTYPAFVLTAGDFPLGERTYRAEHCFELIRKTSFVSFPFGDIESVWFE